MCGIAGFSLTEKDAGAAPALARSLLLGIEERGRHATGAAWTDRAGQVWVEKAALPASEWVDVAEGPSAGSRTAILHTRWASHGSPDDNANNHPVQSGRIVGVHNGIVWNADDLFTLLGPDRRAAEVDSEAVFALLDAGGLPVGDALELLEGSAALAWLDVNDPGRLHLARVSSSPLVAARTTGGSLLFASTEGALRAAGTAAGLGLRGLFAFREGVYLTVDGGRLTGRAEFQVDGGRTLTGTERKALNL